MKPPASSISVLSVASEAVPLVKTGGLADVVGALPAAVAPHGVAMTTLIPGYPKVLDAIGKARSVMTYDALFGAPARVRGKVLDDGRRLLVLDAPQLFAREGGLYGDAAGHDWADNWRRFAALGRAAADLVQGKAKGKRFDLLHAHDWQGALGPVYLASTRAKSHAPSVITIHNMAFQGVFGPEVFGQLGLPRSAWSIEGVEYHGKLGLLKGGIAAADAITTVSPTYALEVRDPAFGMGLEGLIESRSNRVHGVLNGIDGAEWNPASDPALAAKYTAQTLDKRRKNKRALEKEFGLTKGDGPLFICVTRLTWQKGMDVLLEVIDHLVGLSGRLALLGSGDAATEDAFRAAAARHPGKVGIRIGYDEALAHRLQGGGDAILIPSRFEPCGLTQLYGLAYGCVPVVASTGGLADTVIDANVAALAAGSGTGITFSGVTYHALAQAISRTIMLYDKPDVWRSIQTNGMAADFSWAQSGKAYADLYRALLSERG